MFARIMHVQSKPGKLEELTDLYQTSVFPTVKQQDGFISQRSKTEGDR